MTEFTILNNDVTNFISKMIPDDSGYLTDFAILSGGHMVPYQDLDSDKYKGLWWVKNSDYQTKTDHYVSDSRFSDIFSNYQKVPYNMNCYSTRPATSYTKIKNMVEKKGNELLYGEYPQWLVDEKENDELLSKYNQGLFIETGKKYHICESAYYNELAYNGKKYILFEANSSLNGYNKVHFTKNRLLKRYNKYFIEVEPITWLLFERHNIVLSKDLLFGSVPMDITSNKKIDIIGNIDIFSDEKIKFCSFKETYMYQFLNKYFSSEIEPYSIEKNKLLVK